MEFENRLKLVLERIDNPKFLMNDGLGNEIGFWIFDYPAKHELSVRDHLTRITKTLKKRGYKFEHINLFKILIEMLEKRDLFDRACALEKQSGIEELRKSLTGPLNQNKVAEYIADKFKPTNLDFMLMSGLGNAWPLIRGHELLSALHHIMGRTPLVLFYPGEYSGSNLHLFGVIESKGYYRAFKLVDEDESKTQ